jgi:co-chaperonin GroES (HSP10)
MLQPLAKKIIVKPVEPPQGTLILPGLQPTQWHVIAIGDEVTKVAVGDKIYFEKHFAADLLHEKEKFLVIDEQVILAKVTNGQ